MPFNTVDINLVLCLIWLWVKEFFHSDYASCVYQGRSNTTYAYSSWSFTLSEVRSFYSPAWRQNIIILYRGWEEGEDIEEQLWELHLVYVFSTKKNSSSNKDANFFFFCLSINCWPLQRDSKFRVVKAISLPSMAFWVMAAEKALRLLALSCKNCYIM